MGNLSFAWDSCNKILSLVWELCGLTVAQCGVVHTVYKSFGIVYLVFVCDSANKLHFKGLCMLCVRICCPVYSVS
jgi:hypothetical protein